MKGRWVAHHECMCEDEEFAFIEDAKAWLNERHEDDTAYEGTHNPDSCAGFDYIAKITHRSAFVSHETKADYPCPLGICSYCCGGDSLDCPEECPHENPWPWDSGCDEVGDIEMIRQDVFDAADILSVLEVVQKEFDDLEKRTTISKHAKDAVKKALDAAKEGR